VTRSKRSARSRHETKPPEFLVDRNLGKTVPARLADLGWRLQVQRIHQAQAQIYRAVARGGPAVYAIKNDDIIKTRPVA
jgi:hypothetical protein